MRWKVRNMKIVRSFRFLYYLLCTRTVYCGFVPRQCRDVALLPHCEFVCETLHGAFDDQGSIEWLNWLRLEFHVELIQAVEKFGRDLLSGWDMLVDKDLRRLEGVVSYCLGTASWKHYVSTAWKPRFYGSFLSTRCTNPPSRLLVVAWWQIKINWTYEVRRKMSATEYWILVC